MARLIDADELLKRENDAYLIASKHPHGAIITIIHEFVQKLLKQAHTVDGVPVVRCKDCKKRYNPNECPMCILVYGEQHDFTQADGYCDRGERKNNGQA